MKKMYMFIFVVMAALLSQSAAATISWTDPYWDPAGTSNPNVIAFGDAATAVSGSFWSSDALDSGSVHFRAELRRYTGSGSGTFIKVLEEKEIEVCDGCATPLEHVPVDQLDYVAAGEYLVWFTITDSDETRSKQLRLTVLPEEENVPVVTFTATPTTGTEGTTISFTCSVEDGDASFEYDIDFDDGTSHATTTSASRSYTRSHTYSMSETYTARCTVTDDDGDSDYATRTVTISNNAPSVDLDVDPVSGTAPLTVEYDCDASGGNSPLSYNVDFGDGHSSTAPSSTHTFSSAGDYHVNCTVTDADSDRVSDTVTIHVSAADLVPSVSLDVNPTSGTAPLTVSYDCSASGGNLPLSYNINFGDGSATSAVHSSTHTFASAGDYRINCTVTDADSDRVSDAVTVHVGAADLAPAVSLDVTPTSGTAPLTVEYDCDGIGGNAPLSYNVNFGDGHSSTASSGAYTFSSAGDYRVNCTVTDADGDQASDNVLVDVNARNVPSASLTAVPASGPEGMSVAFTCTAVGGDAPLSYLISFHDGTFVNSNRASYVYADAGDYSASCTVTDLDGDSDAADVVVHVSDNSPSVELVATPTSGDAPLEVDFACNVAGGNAPYDYFIDFGDGHFAYSGIATHTYLSDMVYVATCTVGDSDGDLGSDTVSVSVTENSCPVISPVVDHGIVLGNTLTFTISAVDADGDALTYSADAPFAGFINPATGSFSWTPSALQVGTHVATFRVTDGVCSDAQSIDIVVTEPSVNHAPDASFTWSPASPEVGDSVRFTSTSTDSDGDALSCAWDFDNDGFTDSDDCVADYVFTTPGDHTVRLTVSDGLLSDSVTSVITVFGQLNVTSISCFSPVIEESLESCSIRVDGNGVAVGGVNVQLFLLDGTRLNNCVTDTLTGNCVVSFPSGSVGNYTVYATAEKVGWLPDLDTYPQGSFEVLARRYIISNLAVYNDPGFSVEDYDFFRGEDMYVHFMVLDEMGIPADDMVTSVALISPPGGVAWFSEFPHAPISGNYYYSLRIPTTHDFLGDSQVFTFAFNFSDGSGAEMVVEVVIRNNPPVIDPAVSAEFDRTFEDTVYIELTPYESDVEDSGRELRWSVLGVDPGIAEVVVDIDDFLMVTPNAPGYDIITLVLTDLDGATDTIDVPINTGSMVLPQCSDGADNDGDFLVDMNDSGCSSPEDDDEFNVIVLPECSDSHDNDGDGHVDMNDSDCLSPEDDSEYHVPQCSDGIDNDGDGDIDLADAGCSGLSDDDETNAVHIPECRDGVDNDGDDHFDMDDPGCSSTEDDDETDPSVTPECMDDRDNDGDGLFDMDDPGCSVSGDDDESDGTSECQDGIDNDHDGEIDYPEDHACHSPQDNTEGSPAQCADGADNDGDGNTDFPADPDCTSGSDNLEAGALPQCADGIDNDGDGAIDLADEGCTNSADDDEFDIAGNQPPIADLRLSRTFGAPSVIVNIDGSNSYDPDGSIVEHSWMIFGPGNYTYEALHLAGAPTGFDVQLNGIGDYDVRLVVVDDLGADDVEVKRVEVSSSYPQCNNGIDDDGDGKIDWPADLQCSDKDDPYEGEIRIPVAKKPFRDLDKLLVTRVDINGDDVESAVVAPGKELRLGLGLQNNIDVTMDDIKVDVSVQELGIRASDLLRELDPGDSANVVLELEVPEGVEPGLYDLRVVVSNDDERRVKYRTIAIV